MHSTIAAYFPSMCGLSTDLPRETWATPRDSLAKGAKAKCGLTASRAYSNTKVPNELLNEFRDDMPASKISSWRHANKDLAQWRRGGCLNNPQRHGRNDYGKLR